MPPTLFSFRDVQSQEHSSTSQISQRLHDPLEILPRWNVNCIDALRNYAFTNPFDDQHCAVATADFSVWGLWVLHDHERQLSLNDARLRIHDAWRIRISQIPAAEQNRQFQPSERDFLIPYDVYYAAESLVNLYRAQEPSMPIVSCQRPNSWEMDADSFKQRPSLPWQNPQASDIPSTRYDSFTGQQRTPMRARDVVPPGQSAYQLLYPDPIDDPKGGSATERGPSSS